MDINKVGMAQSYQVLSSGMKINSASDNPANLVISEKMNSQINGESTATMNMRNTQSMLRVAESGMSQTSSILQKMRELSVQANNGILTSTDKQSIQKEFTQLRDTLDSIGRNTQFNNKKLLDGSASNINTTTSANNSSTKLSINGVLSSQLSIDNIDLVNNSKVALRDIDKAIEQVSSSRSNIGANSNGLGHSINISKQKEIDTQTSASIIRDTDVSKEITNLNKARILQETYFATQKMQQNMQGQILNLFA